MAFLARAGTALRLQRRLTSVQNVNPFVLGRTPPRRKLATPAALEKSEKNFFDALDTFTPRHIGPNSSELRTMLNTLGFESMDAFVKASVPESIRLPDACLSDASIPSMSESELLRRAKDLAAANKSFKSYIGMGYHNAVVPPVILRNVRTIIRFPALRPLTTIAIARS